LPLSPICSRHCKEEIGICQIDSSGMNYLLGREELELT